MKITSPIFLEKGLILRRYTCEGENINPPLQIENPPEGTKSFALIVHDHDAPSGDFVHWVVWNIDPSVREIKEGKIPKGGIVGINDFDLQEWNGPCPLTGTHNYEFHFYALDRMLDIPNSSDKKDLRESIEGCILEEASLIGLYKRVNI
ncbi:MAG TPA: YbhB/YbcL family Raf kinase inhibitor-like protein [Candidatus Paceibacterota bacterium]|nr:YbhB/YbcL family Raf kinase inhibitor-like protein [Candidatus Paceibacterota bacterium]